MSMELCLFRHGRTSWNAAGRFQGQTDVDLDELGRAQALAVAQRCREIVPVALYSSDLRRCSDVAEAIAEATGAAVVRDARLRERDFGAWAGLTRAEIAEQFPDDFSAWQQGDPDIHLGGGESLKEVMARIDDFARSVSAVHSEGAVVAVTHSGWIRTAMQWTLGESCPRSSFGMPTQGSLTVLRMKDGSPSLDAFNDRGHLLAVEPVDQEPPSPQVH